MAERVNRIREKIIGLFYFSGSIYLGLSIYSYSKWDPSFFTFAKTATKNYGGASGAYLSDLLITLIGLSSFALPFFLFVSGTRRFIGKERQKSHLAGALLFLFSSSLMFSLLFSTFTITAEVNAGGLVGTSLSLLLQKYLFLPGAYIVALSFFLTSVVLMVPFPLSLQSSKKNELPVPLVPPPAKGTVEDNILIRAEEPAPAPVPVMAEPEIPDPILPITPRHTPSQRKNEPQLPIVKEGYTLPPIDFLSEYDSSALRPTKDELLANSGVLQNTLADFNVIGRITHVHSGPVVTMYEFEPAPGVKINRVVSLADDLALAQKAQSMRVSPIPGKATIGIEVPNKQREIVSLREIISSNSFQKSPSLLTLALGNDIFGVPVIADLAKMPHLLVAGATGAGKSVSINSMVMSLLYKATPAEVKMLMIDPKLLELSIYEDIPHLISPVITNPKKAAEALRKMVFEMERRYKLIAEKGARNIDSFNQLATGPERLPYIVVFIDELADLMFASSNEVEDSITRLAQMARAAGIHLIIATQRPSVDVITGLIKANFPARISFQVFSKIDSRTILDTQGAEQLLGKGDMLLMLPGARIMRVHGALITEQEIVRLTEFVKAQGRPDFSTFEQIPIEEPKEEEEDSGDRDELYYKAIEFADSVGEVSISSLQRKFKIGYNRAARVMELMESDGLVGPPKGAGKPRDYIGRHNL